MSIEPAVPLVQPVDNLSGLQYNTFKYLNIDSSLFPLKAQSGKNVIGGALVGNLAAGSIQVAASGSIVGTEASPYFDLSSLYYACYVYAGPQTLTTLASPCTLAISGFDYQDRAVSAAGIAYTPGSAVLTKTPMLFQHFSQFVKMKNVTIGVASASPATALGVLILDDIVHCNYAA